MEVVVVRSRVFGLLEQHGGLLDVGGGAADLGCEGEQALAATAGAFAKDSDAVKRWPSQRPAAPTVALPIASPPSRVPER